ncbi:MAG: Sapep family Mn(2+)-dependent dipeptidase [Bacilli bacterium]|nr:Sapep family Mn(2+)-dependent dipeptidase [Bacilli bacterium]
MPNFKKLAKNYYSLAEKALQEFVRIPSVYDEKTIKDGQPFGKEVKRALDYLAKLGEDYGFKVDKCDGYCTELSIGESGPLIGIYGHSDVVPVTGKWTDKPFDAVIHDERMWGRGTTDDKGPVIACLYAIKLLKDNGLLKNFRVKLVSGGDEERGSSCLRYYFEKHHGEAPRFGFTPDADYPLIYAEKGIRHHILSKESDLSPIIAMDGGVVSNAVNDSLLVTLKPDKELAKYLKEVSPETEVTISDVLMICRFKGKTSHGSTPELGENAGLKAFKLLGDFYKNADLKKIYEALKDPFGASFGGECLSKELGHNTYNYGIFKYDGKTLKISLDFRFGEEAKPLESLKKLEEASGLKADEGSEAEMLIYDKKSPLVSTLMKAYKKETHKFFDKPLAIGGGTYAKEAPNTVAFGACFKGHPGDMHSPNEYIYLEDFHKDIAIYARAIYMLGNLK